MQPIEIRKGSARLGMNRSGDGTLLIELAGGWLLESGAPTFDAIMSVLTQEQGLIRAAYDASGLVEWDSAAISFLVQTSQCLQSRGIAENRSGLPSGLQRLIALAQAVPERAGARGVEKREPLLARIGAAGIGLGSGIAEYLSFVGQCGLAFAKLLRGRARYRREDFLIVLESCGPNALGIVALISFLVGVILAFMGAVQLQQFGASIYVADLVAIGMARDMGAMMTAIIMSGRTGAAFAAQLGSMKVTQEIDALTTMGNFAVRVSRVAQIHGACSDDAVALCLFGCRRYVWRCCRWCRDARHPVYILLSRDYRGCFTDKLFRGVTQRCGLWSANRRSGVPIRIQIRLQLLGRWRCGHEGSR